MRYALKYAALAASLVVVPVGLAHAQNMGSRGFKPVVGAARGPAPGAPPPSGLPGAQAPEGGVAPPTIQPTDMQPTDALFDAINRGDITTARDAMARGADMNAHNVLGMTPLELSIDLSRNDITFYLLSMHPLDNGGPPSRLANVKDAPPASVKPVAGKPAAKRLETVRAARAERPAATPPAPQYAGGGTPDPAAGFLGFGGGTQIR